MLPTLVQGPEAEQSIGKAHWVLNLLGLEVTLEYFCSYCVYHLAPCRPEDSGKQKPWSDIFGVWSGSATSPPNTTYISSQVKLRILEPSTENVSISLPALDLLFVASGTKSSFLLFLVPFSLFYHLSPLIA